MALFRRRSELPDEVRDRAGLAAGERVLASARADDAWLLGTRDRLLVVPDDGDPTALAWQEVDRAGWEADDKVLRFSEVGRWGDPLATRRFSFADADPEGPVRLLQLVRERVTASILLQRRTAVSGKRGLTVHARRPPSGGEVTWLVEYDEGVDPADPAVRALAGAAVAAAQGEV